MGTDDRLVQAILAAQIAVVRDRIENSETIDLMWRTTDVLARLAGLVPELARRNPGADMERQCTSAIANMTDISKSLDDMAFVQAQRQDYTRQMADCVAIALTRLAAQGAGESTFSADDLTKLYVCAEQREVHDTALRAFYQTPGLESTQ
jgi:hypothetical protein